MKTTRKNEDKLEYFPNLKNETDLKNEDDLKNEEDQKYEVDLKYEDILKNEDNHQNQENLKMADEDLGSFPTKRQLCSGIPSSQTYSRPHRTLQYVWRG